MKRRCFIVTSFFIIIASKYFLASSNIDNRAFLKKGWILKQQDI